MNITKNKSVIPAFNLLLFRKFKFIHSHKDFCLCEAKTVSIFFRSSSDNF